MNEDWKFNIGDIVVVRTDQNKLRRWIGKELEITGRKWSDGVDNQYKGRRDLYMFKGEWNYYWAERFELVEPKFELGLELFII